MATKIIRETDVMEIISVKEYANRTQYRSIVVSLHFVDSGLENSFRQQLRDARKTVDILNWLIITVFILKFYMDGMYETMMGKVVW